MSTSRFQEVAKDASRPGAWSEDLERFLWVSLLAACLTSVLLITAGDFPPDGTGPLAARWWAKWLFLFYLGIGCAAFLAVAGLTTLIGRPRLRRQVLALIGLAFLGVALISNPRPAAEAIGFGGESLAALPALLLSVLGILLTSLPLSSGLWAVRLVAALTLAASLMFFYPEFRSRRGASPLLDSAAEATGERLLLLGLDGADWRYMDQLIARGDLPHLARLREAGVWGPLGTLQPTASPAIWTTMATGRSPQEHGIRGHTVYRPRNGYYRLPNPAPGVRRLGVHRLLMWLRRTGMMVRSPSTSTERRVPAFWNIASHFGSPVTIVNWWATWPAEPILGRMVSDRAYFWRWAARGVTKVQERATFPESLYDEIAGRIMMRPEEVTLEHIRRLMVVSAEEFEQMRDLAYQHHDFRSELKYYVSMFMTHRRIARYLIDRDLAQGQTPADLIVLTRIIDFTSHSCMKFSELITDHLDSTPAEVAKYGHAVTEAYRMADEVVGELTAAFGASNVVVLSDHGFQYEEWKRGEEDLSGYSHNLGPAGIFLAAGPAFTRGRLEELDVYDVLPVLLHLKGFPLARDLLRGLPKGVFSEDFLARHPVRTIDTYAPLEIERGAFDGSALDHEMLERLEALGYVD